MKNLQIFLKLNLDRFFLLCVIAIVAMTAIINVQAQQEPFNSSWQSLVVARCRIKSVNMLGVEGELKFDQKDDALHVTLPETKTSKHAICLKITPDLIPVPKSLEKR
jgi:hypothetical protein